MSELIHAMDEAIQTALGNMWPRDGLRFLMSHTGKAKLRVEMAKQGQHLKLSAQEDDSFRGIPIDVSSAAAKAFQRTGMDFDLVGIQPK